MGSLAYMFGAAPSAYNVPVTTTPTPGFFYQVKAGDTPWAVAKRGYADRGLVSVKTGLFLLNDSPWNAHIKKGPQGWTSYKIDGLQLTKNYDPTAAPSAFGSGKQYPLLWVPPIDAREPGDMGGGSSEPGAPGADGRPPTAAEVLAAVQAYLLKNPPPAGARGERGPIGLPGAASPDTIKALINDYLKNNPIKAIKGAKGERGEAGPPGRPPMPGEIRSVLNDYMKDNPLQTTPGFDPGGGGLSSMTMEDARNFVDSRIRSAIRNIKHPEATAGGGSVNYWAIAAVGLLSGLGATVLTKKRKGASRGRSDTLTI